MPSKTQTIQPSKPPKTLRSNAKLSRPQLLIFALVFGVIGGFILYRTFAASPLVASIEAEQMSLPTGAAVITDANASAGKALYLPSNGTTSGSVNFPSPVTSFTLIARGAQCSGAPTFSARLDSTPLLTNTAVGANSWTAYTYSPTNPISSGTHSLSISFNNDYSQTTTRKHRRTTTCSRDLYLDVSNFYGQAAPPPSLPTVTISASPNTLTAGQASTLTWNSTGATSCTASGSWSGSQSTSGSVSTGALNQSSTYNLACSGAGGTASGSAVVSVSGVPPLPPSSSWAYIVASPVSPGASITNMSGLGMNITSLQNISDKVIDGTGDTGVLFQLNAGGSSMNRVRMTGVAAGNAVSYGKHGIYGKAPGLTLQDLDISCSSYCASVVSLRYDGAQLRRFKLSGAPHAITYYETSTTAGTVTIENGSGSFTGDTAIWMDAETDYTQQVIQEYQ